MISFPVCLLVQSQKSYKEGRRIPTKRIELKLFIFLSLDLEIQPRHHSLTPSSSWTQPRFHQICGAKAPQLPGGGTRTNPAPALVGKGLGLSSPPGWGHQNIPSSGQGLGQHKSIFHLGLLLFYLLTGVFWRMNKIKRGKAERRKSCLLMIEAGSVLPGFSQPTSIWDLPKIIIFSKALSTFLSLAVLTLFLCRRRGSRGGSRAVSGTWLVPGTSLE